MKKKSKGEYGYLKYQRTFTMIRTIVYFALSLGLLLLGYFSTNPHTTRNLLTIVAVLGCLPGSKSGVNMIMFMKSGRCSEEAYRRIEAVKGQQTGLYELVLTSYEKTFELSHVTVSGNTIIGLSESKKCEEKACEKHIAGMLRENKIKDVTVKIFTDMDKYITRVKEVNQLAMENRKDMEDILQLLLNLSL